MKFREILQKYVINNIGYKILAILFAFLLWLVVLNITDPDYTRTISNIPVQILNEPRVLDGSHVYTVSSGDTTSVIVTGKRSIISTLSANDFVATADFAELSITNAVPIKVELTGDKLKYSGQITITAKDTSMILNLEDMTSKQVQVEVEYKGEISDSIVIEEANIAPKKVTIYAPESVTNATDKVVVMANYADIESDTIMYLEPIIKNVNGEVIKQGDNISLDEDEIMVEFKVSHKKDVPIKVSTSGTVKSGYTIESIELSQDYISVKGSESAINSLSQIEIPGEELNVNGADQDITMEIDVTPYLPEGTSVYGESPTVLVDVHIVSNEEHQRLQEAAEAEQQIEDNLSEILTEELEGATGETESPSQEDTTIVAESEETAQLQTEKED
jgi:YbbR domain-containing protein